MKHFLFLCLAAFSLQAFGYDYKVDGIYYNFNSTDRTAEVTYYSQYANYGDYSGSVTIPTTVTYSNLVYAVTSIGSSAFAYSSKLSSVTIPNSVTSINYKAFYGCSALREIVIPDKVPSIASQAFEGCNSLESVILSDSLKSIYANAFDSCTSLDTITLPSHLTNIYSAAFNFCTNLSRITSLNPEPPTCSDDAFYYVDTSTCKLYVPQGSKEAYATADVWKDFINIEEISTTSNESFDLTSNPESGSTLSELSSFTVCGNVEGMELYDSSTRLEVVKDGETVAYADYVGVAENAEGFNEVSFAINNEDGEAITLTDVGEYTIEIPAEYIKAGDDMAYNNAVTLTYIISESTGINSINAALSEGINEIYNLSGQRIQGMQNGKVNIVKFSDGTTKKIILK